MIKFLSTLSVVVFATAPAWAADDVMANFYGNTVISTGGIAEIHTHYRPDHSFEMIASRLGFSRTFKGIWAIDAKNNLCRTFVGDVPPDTANPLCTPFTQHKIGETWTLDVNGSKRTVTLKAGVE
jgi:hypothetical protein